MIRANRQKGKPATERLWPRPSLGAPPDFPRLGFAPEQTKGDRPRLAIFQATGRPFFAASARRQSSRSTELGRAFTPCLASPSPSPTRRSAPRAARPAPSGTGQEKTKKQKTKNKKNARPALARKPGDFESGFRPSGLARARRERAKAADQRSLNSRRCWLVAHHAPHMPKNATAAAIAAISRPVKKRHVKPKP